MLREREARSWSTIALAERARAIAHEEGDPIKLSQQLVSKFEQGKAKRMPSWLRYVEKAFEADANETKNDIFLDTAAEDASVMIERLPTYAGAGGGGTGEGDAEYLSFSRSLVEQELHTDPRNLLAIFVDGNSMSPDFESGDTLLVDRRKVSTAQPGAFCLWDGDGYVVKYVERIYDTEPPKLRIVSRNEIFSPAERLAEEVQVMGRVVWFGRKV